MDKAAIVEMEAVNARQRLIDAERVTVNALAAARGMIITLEEELRQARLEAARRDDEFLTEQEFAAIMRVSKKTIADARKAGLLKPIYITPDIWRYSRVHHVAKAREIFPDEPRRRARGPYGPRKKKKAGEVIPNSRFQIPEAKRPAA